MTIAAVAAAVLLAGCGLAGLLHASFGPHDSVREVSMRIAFALLCLGAAVRVMLTGGL